LQTFWEAWWHLLLNVLVAINSVVHNPGVSIIVFTLLIKLLTVPLTVKALRSSRNMQQIQPLIREVQKKYAKDRAKQQEETMKIYQQYGINPASSCFPMLVQIPIFLGLYSALQFTLQHGANAEMLRPILFNDSWVSWANFSQPFLWVTNLALPDPFYIWPVLSGIFQFIQSRMAMPLRDPTQPVDPQTRMMNGMMQFMPIYITLISLGFPAGTVIYWAMSNVFSAVQQYFITGFGSLPTFPGFGWLPRKEMTVPEPPPPPEVRAASSAPARKGVMAWMMDKALEAQETQKAAQNQTTNGSRTGGSEEAEYEVASGADALRAAGRRTDAARRASARARAKGKGSERPQGVSTRGVSTQGASSVKVVPTSTMKYASDLKYRENASGNGAHDDEEAVPSAPSALPRKRRGKK
jgi:YidC/Oxa1 family membrane protein insertase